MLSSFHLWTDSHTSFHTLIKSFGYESFVHVASTFNVKIKSIAKNKTGVKSTLSHTACASYFPSSNKHFYISSSLCNTDDVSLLVALSLVVLFNEYDKGMVNENLCLTSEQYRRPEKCKMIIVKWPHLVSGLIRNTSFLSDEYESQHLTPSQKIASSAWDRILSSLRQKVKQQTRLYIFVLCCKKSGLIQKKRTYISF